MSLYEESGDKQDGCEVSRKCLGTSRTAVKSQGRVWRTSRIAESLYEESWNQQDSFEVSRKSLGTSRMAVESLKSVLD